MPGGRRIQRPAARVSQAAGDSAAESFSRKSATSAATRSMIGTGPVVIRTKPARPNSLPARTRKPAARQPLCERDVVHADVDEEEVRLRGYGVGAGLAEALGQALAPRVVRQPAVLDELGAPQARPARGEGGAVDVERLLDDVEELGERLADDRVAEAQAREPEDLRERPHDDDRRPASTSREPVEAHARVDVLDVGLVDDDRAALGDAGEQPLPLVARDEGAGRVVRVAEPDQPGARARARLRRARRRRGGGRGSAPRRSRAPAAAQVVA